MRGNVKSFGFAAKVLRNNTLEAVHGYIYVYFGMEMNREGILMKKQEMRMLSNMMIKGNNGVVNKYNVSRRIWKGEAPPYCLVWVRANSIQKRGRSQLEKVRNLLDSRGSAVPRGEGVKVLIGNTGWSRFQDSINKNDATASPEELKAQQRRMGEEYNTE